MYGRILKSPEEFQPLIKNTGKEENISYYFLLKTKIITIRNVAFDLKICLTWKLTQAKD